MMRSRPRAVVIGTSAGAVTALSRVLPSLPADYPLPVFVVVHIPADRDNAIAEIFQTKCVMSVREAEDKEVISPGVIYFAPPDYHLLVENDAMLALSTDEQVLHSRPSIDVLFESAADVYGPDLIGVILTGANADGADGARAIVLAGGTVYVEDPEHAYADAMPMAALKACPGAHVLALDAIGPKLVAEGRR